MHAAADLLSLSHFADISQRLLRLGNLGISRIAFLEQVSQLLLDSSGCDAVDLRLSDGEVSYRWRATRRPRPTTEFLRLPHVAAADCPSEAERSLELLRRELLTLQLQRDPELFTPRGSFWIPATEAVAGRTILAAGRELALAPMFEPYGSCVLIRFSVDADTLGLLQFSALRSGVLTRELVESLEQLSDTLGLAIATRRAQSRLRERVKELSCLYAISHIASDTTLPLSRKLEQIVALLPPAWQFPDLARARITIDREHYGADNLLEARARQEAAIVVDGRRRGSVELFYTGTRPEFAEGPFLPEEAKLIQRIAREIAALVEQQEDEQERQRLAAQLRHADRLATIGQLAAGIAHELNEPLANILGFAQLLQKSPLPETAGADVSRIIEASLHAREIIRNMLLFARENVPRRIEVDVNCLVREALRFVAPRTTRGNVTVTLKLAEGRTSIVADPAQIQQVLLNLAINAVQAMPDGGELTIETQAEQGGVRLAVQDTGVGMPEEVQRRVFDPFFTTKDVGEGTGLGLSVVHGIIEAHGGRIHFESQVGRGTRFDVWLPRSARAAENAPAGAT